MSARREVYLIEVDVAEQAPHDAWKRIAEDLLAMDCHLSIRSIDLCEVCGAAVAVDTLRRCPWLDNKSLCKACLSIAMLVKRDFDEAAARHWLSVQRQLPQVIRDIRAGARVPTFFHGID